MKVSKRFFNLLSLSALSIALLLGSASTTPTFAYTQSDVPAAAAVEQTAPAGEEAVSVAEEAKDAPEGFFAPLFEQAAALIESINSKQAQIQAMKDEFAAETAPAEDADFESVVDATEDDGTAADDEDGIEIEITVEKDDDKEE